MTYSDEYIEKLRRAIGDFVKAWREKRYTEKGMDAMATVAGSSDAHKHFGSTEKSYLYLTDLIAQSADEQTVITKFCRELGDLD